MTCERFLYLLDGLDEGLVDGRDQAFGSPPSDSPRSEGAVADGAMGLPPAMAEHLRSCPACAAEAAAARTAIALYRLPDLASSVDLVPRISALIPFLPAPRRVVSMRDWLVWGAALAGSTVLIPLLGGFRELKGAYGSGFTFPLSLILGLVLTMYAGMFVLSHLDELTRRLRERDAGQGGQRVARA